MVSSSDILIGKIILRISPECDRPAVGYHPAIQDLCALEADGDDATVAVYVALFTADI